MQSVGAAQIQPLQQGQSVLVEQNAQQPMYVAPVPSVPPGFFEHGAAPFVPSSQQGPGSSVVYYGQAPQQVFYLPSGPVGHSALPSVAPATAFFGAPAQSHPVYFTHSDNYQHQINAGVPHHQMQPQHYIQSTPIYGGPQGFGGHISHNVQQYQPFDHVGQMKANGSSMSSAPSYEPQSYRPVCSSTPLPPEGTVYPSPFHSQIPRHDGGRNAYLTYNRRLEDDDLVGNMSRISTVSEMDELDQSRQFEPIGDALPPRIEMYSARDLRRSGAPQHAMPLTSAERVMSYKTRMCTQFNSSGRCDLGDQCRFAHGSDELRPPNLSRAMTNPKYKTKMCKNFAHGGSGVCPYGARCEFIHPEDQEYAAAHIDVAMGDLSLSSSGRPADTTPQLPSMAPPPTVTRSAVKDERFFFRQPETVKQRGMARSLQCLSSVPRRDVCTEDSGLNSNESGEKTPHASRLCVAAPPFDGSRPPFMDHVAHRRSMSNLRVGSRTPPPASSSLSAAVPLKFARRRAYSTLSVNKSEERGMAALVESWKASRNALNRQ